MLVKVNVFVCCKRIEDMRFCIEVIDLYVDIDNWDLILFVVLSLLLCLVFPCFVCWAVLVLLWYFSEVEWRLKWCIWMLVVDVVIVVIFITICMGTSRLYFVWVDVCFCSFFFFFLSLFSKTQPNFLSFFLSLPFFLSFLGFEDLT